MYELKETPIMEQPVVDTSNFITRSEFDDVINRLKNYLEAFTSEARAPAAASVPVEAKPEKSQRSFDF
jgi:hypothetical protein